MNKLVIYTLLVLGTLGTLLIVGLVKDGMHDIVNDSSGLQFVPLEESDIIMPTQDVFYFTDRKGDDLLFYKKSGFLTSGSLVNLSVYSTDDKEESIFSLASKDIRNELTYTESMDGLTDIQFFHLISNIDNFEGIKLYRYNYEPGWFGFVDDSVIIFVIFGLVFFIICLIFNSLIAYIEKRFGKRIEPIFYGLIFIFLGWWTSLINFPLWFPYDSFYDDIRNFCSVLLPFLTFRIVKSKIQHLVFADREVIKFFTIIIGTFLIGYVMSRIGFAIEARNNENIIMVEGHGPFKIIMGIAVSIAGGNILANMIRHVIAMRVSDKLHKKAEIKLSKSNAELDTLQSNINPHFLHNSLNSIASTARTDGEKTEKMAIALSEFYSYVTNRQGQQITTLRAEIEMLTNYLEVEKIRFGHTLVISLDIEDSALPMKIPRLLLQPIVENSIKYGYHDGRIKVSVDAKRFGDTLIIKIYDSGSRFSDDIQMGFGIKSVTKKLQAYYPDKHALEFNNLPSKHVLISIQN